MGFFVAAFAFCAAGQGVAAIAVMWMPRPVRVHRETPLPRSAFHRIFSVHGMKTAVFASFVTLVTIDLLTAYLPLWAEDRGISAVEVGWLLAIRGAGSLVSRGFFPLLSRMLGHVTLATVSTALTSISIALLLIANLQLAIILMALVGITLGFMQPLTMSWVVALAPRGAIAAALGIRLSGNRLGQAAIPLVAGGLALFVPSPTGVVFLLTAGLLLASSATSDLLRRVQRAGD
jgi:MFS family permease